MTEVEVLEKVREKIGNQETSGVTDRTVQDFYANWKEFETDENSSVILDKILKQCETVKGQHSNAMRQLVQKEQELQSFKTEKDKLTADLEELRKKTVQTPPVTPTEKKEVNEEMQAIMAQLSALTTTISDLQREKTEAARQELVAKRKETVIALVNDPKSGMPIEAITETLIEFWDFSKDKSVEDYLKEIQDKYNEKAKKMNPQFAPLAGYGGRGTNTESYIERKRKERAAEEERKAAKLSKINEKYKY